MSAGGPDWARLFRIARSLIRQVNSNHPIIDKWSLGGGTAMMIHIGHRRSDDIDVFLQDPQLLPYLDPGLNDFDFERRPTDHQGDGSNFLKLTFEGIGEIDFIVGAELTDSPTTRRTVDGEVVDVETIAEIITKKIHFRGSHITPRDIFDIAAAAKTHNEGVVNALKRYRSDVAATLTAMDRLNPDFVYATISALAIEDAHRSTAVTALADARALLKSV